MNYRELQKALKIARNAGLTTIKLNQKKEVLQAEYDRITNRSIKAEQKNCIPANLLRQRADFNRQKFDDKLSAIQSRQDRIELSIHCAPPRKRINAVNQWRPSV